MSAARHIAAEHGVRFIVTPLTRDNYRDVLAPLLGGRRFPAQPVGRRLLASR